MLLDNINSLECPGLVRVFGPDLKPENVFLCYEYILTFTLIQTGGVQCSPLPLISMMSIYRILVQNMLVTVLQIILNLTICFVVIAELKLTLIFRSQSRLRFRSGQFHHNLLASSVTNGCLNAMFNLNFSYDPRGNDP